jgi:cell division protein FtsN
MAAKRGKTQARRSGGGGNGGGMPGWAWLVIGAAIAFGVVFAYQRSHETGRDGFFRPTPNPDAQPKTASEDAVVEDEAIDDPAAKPRAASAEDAKKKQDFDFYTLLPGKEVPMTDAELAASEKAEQAQVATKPAPAPAPATTAQAAPPAAAVETKPLPAPVDESAPKVASADERSASAPSTAAPAKAAEPADARYILQAGAFQASGQAEELKAKIALLGLGARVESAQIGGKTVYRVRMGPYGTAGELADAKRKLGAGGLSAMAVKTQ